MDVMQAAFNLAEDFRPGRTAGLALAIDKNPTTLAHELKETGGAKLGLLTAVKMTKYSGDLRILLAFAAECGQMCVPLPDGIDASADECMVKLASMSKEFGEVCQEICISLGNDGKITDNELARIERESGELVRAINAVLTAVRSRNHQLHQAAHGADR